MKALNIWLCEHLDFNLAYKITGQQSVNVLVHGTVLSKFPPSCSRIISPFFALNKKQEKDYCRWIKKWDWESREPIRNGFKEWVVKTSRCEVNETLFGALERLLYHCKNGCLAAVIFFSRISELISRDTKVRVIAGENYRMTELMSMLWWVSLCNRKLKDNKVEYVFISRKAKYKKTESFEEFLLWVSENSLIKPRLQGDISIFNEKEETKSCIAWVSTIRFHQGWASEIEKKSVEFERILRITQFGQGNLHESPCLEINAGNAGSLKNLLRIIENAEYAQSQIDWSVLSKDLQNGFESIGNAVETFFTSAIGPHVLSQVSQMADLLEEKFSFVKPEVFYSAAAPLLESLGVHEWVSRRTPDLLPTLLPHSFTPSHEFPASAYQSLLSFISAKEIMPTILDDSNSLGKERLVSLSKIQKDHLGNLPRQNLFIARSNKRLSDIVKTPKAQLLPILTDRMINCGKEFFKRHHYCKVLRAKKHRFGLLLNYEHYEYCIGLDFMKFFQSIADLGQELEAVFGNHAALILRKKPGWTNLRILNKVLLATRTDSFSKTILTSPPSVSLKDFGEACDLVFCFQGTSAIPELMMNGVPCIFLKSRNLPEKLEADYIVLPKDIVPHIDLKTVRSNLNDDPNWNGELAKKQSRWIKSQMTTTENTS
jgi:hypothetical protein